MKEKKKIIITSVLIIVWMIAAFYLSNQKAEESSQLSGEITQTILKILNLTEKQTIEQQLFVLGRSGEIRDVCIDSFGVITGIIILLLVLKMIEKIRKNIASKKAS